MFEIRDNFSLNRPESFDILIDCYPDAPHGFETFACFPIKKCLKAHSDSPLAGQKLQLSQLSNQSFITMGENDFTHQLLVGKCKQAGFTPNFSVICNDTKSMEYYLQTGMAIGYGGIKSFTNTGVSNLEVVDLDIRYNIYAHYKKSSNYENVELFLDYLRNLYDKQLNFIKSLGVNPLQIY